MGGFHDDYLEQSKEDKLSRKLTKKFAGAREWPEEQIIRRLRKNAKQFYREPTFGNIQKP